MDERADLVLVEYTVNDNAGYADDGVDSPKVLAFERLLRKLLRQPHAPAVVLVHAMPSWMIGHKLPFYESSEPSSWQSNTHGLHSS